MGEEKMGEDGVSDFACIYVRNGISIELEWMPERRESDMPPYQRANRDRRRGAPNAGAYLVNCLNLQKKLSRSPVPSVIATSRKPEEPREIKQLVTVVAEMQL